MLKGFVLSKKGKYFSWGSKIIILELVALVGLIVYITGGTTSFVHLMYIPIILTVVLFGFKASIVTSIIGGLVLGPYMPLHVSNGIMQETSSWIFRIIMFIIVALFVNILYKDIEKHYENEKDRAYQDVLTGYPNANRFKEDLDEMVKDNGGIISLALFEFTNKDMINQYLDFNTAQEAFMNLINKASNVFDDCKLYTISPEQFAIIIQDIDRKQAFEMACEFTDMLNEPMYVNTLPISVIVKGSIVSYPYHDKDTDELMRKLQKTLSQPMNQKNVSIYDDNFEIERRDYYNTLVFLYDSLKNNMFELAYQPKINLNSQKVVGVEALLRLKNNSEKNLSIGKLISIAEDAGFINEITKWVIKTAIAQIREWKDNGLDICVSINLSANDIVDDSIICYTKDLLKEYNVEPSRVEFELTERSIINDLDRAYEVLNNTRELGVKISLDDYGIGHNSLVYLVDSDFPYDYIKIDKGFIDNIDKAQNQSLINGIIRTAHILNIKVIAEGVETAEQVDILNKIGCDIIQGYYYSRPVPPNEVVNFIGQMDKV